MSHNMRHIKGAERSVRPDFKAVFISAIVKYWDKSGQTLAVSADSPSDLGIVQGEV